MVIQPVNSYRGGKDPKSWFKVCLGKKRENLPEKITCKTKMVWSHGCRGRTLNSNPQ
jgi:hypothetical protein